MKIEVELGGSMHTLEISRAIIGKNMAGRSVHFIIDGVAGEADTVEVAAGIFSILIDGTSLEAQVERFGGGLRIRIGEREFAVTVRDPRKWQRNHDAAAASEQRHNVVAPMPGRVVRVLVAAGDAVKAGQGIAVVEAMKMQNEIRSARAGKLERLFVKEGQPVNAGETIAVVG